MSDSNELIRKKFNVYECSSCNASIVMKEELGLYLLHELNQMIDCCNDPYIIDANINKTDTIYLNSSAEGYEIKTYYRALTYEPKIKLVLNKIIKQTIRPIGEQPIKTGDIIILHGWEGFPYRSKWSWRIKFWISKVENIVMYQDGIMQDKIFFRWIDLGRLAIADGIEKLEGKTYGESMGILFNEMYGKELEKGKKMQIIHWNDFEWLVKPNNEKVRK